MTSQTPPAKRQNRTKSVVVHLNIDDYCRTLKAADECGLQTGPWVRMHLLNALKELEKKNGR